MGSIEISAITEPQGILSMTVARKEQQALEKEYQDSLNTLLPIKEQLTN